MVHAFMVVDKDTLILCERDLKNYGKNMVNLEKIYLGQVIWLVLAHLQLTMNISFIWKL